MSRHDADAVSLMFGLVLVLAAALFLLADLTALDLQVRWVGPVALLAVGAGGLAATARRVRDSGDGPVGDGPVGDGPGPVGTAP